MRSGILLGSHFLVRAQAGIDHQSKIQRLLGFRLKDIDLLLHAFLENLKGFDGQVRGGAVVVVENADQHVHKIDVDLDGAARRDGAVALALLWDSPDLRCDLVAA